MWPPSTARIATAHPTLRWSGDGAVRVELCRDRACADVIERTAARGGSLAVATALRGAVFWRLTADAPGATPSKPWRFSVAARPAEAGRVTGRCFDVNGDGHADAILPGGVYRGQSAAPYLVRTPLPWTDGAVPSDAGDVNGDGFSDVLAASARGGPLRLHLGSDAGLSATASATIEAPQRSTTWGSAVSGLGDVNGDGYDDVAVGVPGRSVVYLYAGSADGLGPRPAAELRRWRGCEANLGVRVVALHDLNGDGLSDFGVAASQGMGSLGLFLGGPAWPAATPAWTRAVPYSFGEVASVYSAGDVDGDGFADALQDEASDPPLCRGTGWIRGGERGPGDAPVDAAQGRLRRFVRSCSAAGRHPEGAVVPVGDMDGDGFDDALLTEVSDDGRARGSFARGGPGGLGATVDFAPADFEGATKLGDVDRDGYDDVLLRVSSDPEGCRIVRGAAPGSPMAASPLPCPRSRS